MVGGADNAWAQIGLDDLGKFALLQVTGMLQGLAFGLLFLNSSAAIVSYFVLPTALDIVGTFWPPGRGAAVDRPVDLAGAAVPGRNISGEQWAQCATSTLIWVVLPFAVGLVRVLRARGQVTMSESTRSNRTRSSVTSEVFI